MNGSTPTNRHKSVKKLNLLTINLRGTKSKLKSIETTLAK